MNLLLSSVLFRRIFKVAIIPVAVATIIILAQTVMSISMSNDLDKYESRKGYSDIIAQTFGAVAVVAAMFSFYWGSKVDELQKQHLLELQATIANANARSDSARAESQKASAVAEEARARQKEAELSQKKVELRQKQVEQKNLELEIKLNESQKDLTEEIQKRIHLAQAFSPRLMTRQDEAISKPTKHKGSLAIVQCVAYDREAQHIAEQIVYVLHKAGFEIVRPCPQMIENAMDGIKIESSGETMKFMLEEKQPPDINTDLRARGQEMNRRSKRDEQAEEITNILIATLQEDGITSTSGRKNTDMPEKGILVIVGSKPNPEVDERQRSSVYGNRARF